MREDQVHDVVPRLKNAVSVMTARTVNRAPNAVRERNEEGL